MLTTQITNDVKEAMKAKDAQTVSVLRMVLSAFNNEAINLMKKDEGLNDEEALKVLKKEVKKRKDSIEQYKAGNREDLAEAEVKELIVLEKYLPAEMGESEIKQIVEEVIGEMGGSVAPSQFGAVMKAVMAKTAGSADGALVTKLVKETLVGN
ncbi:MAG TPA: GatB/YqeY domain-containing protein [bacterium]|nr:GatB/YqeY domain-containing protein [bacterium]